MRGKLKRKWARLTAPSGPQNIGEIISQAEGTADFQRFSEEFDTWGVHNSLTAEERALHFGLGAFNKAGGAMVEIGTFEGASALFAMAGLRHRGSGKLISLDPHLGAPPFLGSAPWQFTLDKFRANARRAGLLPFVRSIVSDSQVAASIWPSMPIDSVLIDGDHSYNGALRDVECWAVKLKPEGFLLIDDANDPVLQGLLLLIEDLKELRGLRFEALIEGIAVFRRAETDSFELLEEFKTLRNLPSPRPWDMQYIQKMVPDSRYKVERLATGGDLRTAYQLGFFARCEPGDYAVAHDAPASDVDVIDALVRDRQDGLKAVVEPDLLNRGGFRMVMCSIDQASKFRGRLLPGGVLIARSALPATYENSIAERERLRAAGFDGCGWSDQIHWGFARPHYISPDAIVGYINENMKLPSDA